MKSSFKWLFVGLVDLYAILQFVICCGRFASAGFLQVVGYLFLGLFLLFVAATLTFAVIKENKDYLKFLLPAGFAYLLLSNALNVGAIGALANLYNQAEEPVLVTAYVFMAIGCLVALIFVILLILEKFRGSQLSSKVNLSLLVAIAVMLFMGSLLSFIGSAQSGMGWISVVDGISSFFLYPGLVFGYLYYQDEVAA